MAYCIIDPAPITRFGLAKEIKQVERRSECHASPMLYFFESLSKIARFILWCCQFFSSLDWWSRVFWNKTVLQSFEANLYFGWIVLLGFLYRHVNRLRRSNGLSISHNNIALQIRIRMANAIQAIPLKQTSYDFSVLKNWPHRCFSDKDSCIDDWKFNGLIPE